MHDGRATVNVWVELAATDEEATPKSCCVVNQPGLPCAINTRYDDKLIGAVQLVWFASVNDAVLVLRAIELKLIDLFWTSASNSLAESVQGVEVGVNVKTTLHVAFPASVPAQPVEVATE